MTFKQVSELFVGQRIKARFILLHFSSQPKEGYTTLSFNFHDCGRKCKYGTITNIRKVTIGCTNSGLPALKLILITADDRNGIEFKTLREGLMDDFSDKWLHENENSTKGEE